MEPLLCASVYPLVGRGVRAPTRPPCFFGRIGYNKLLLESLTSELGWPLYAGSCKHGPKFSFAICSKTFRGLYRLCQLHIPSSCPDWCLFFLPQSFTHPFPVRPLCPHHPVTHGITHWHHSRPLSLT